MTSVFARLCIIAAATVFGAVGLSPPALAQPEGLGAPPKGWTAADQSEMKAVLDQGVVPMMNELNAAVSLAASDAPKACAQAKAAGLKVDEIEQRVNALYDRLKSEGKDVSRLAELKGKVQEMKSGVPDAVKSICQGNLKPDDSDPQVRAAQEKVMFLIKRYTADMAAATDAMSKGDKPLACSKITDGATALGELETYVSGIAATARAQKAPPEALAQVDQFITQVHQWQAETRTTLQGCPAH
jgi:hypothetical protein